MTDMVLSIQSLQETLPRLIQTDKVRLREVNGEIYITPIMENSHADRDRFLAAKHVPVQIEDKINRLNALRGSGSDLKMTVDSFLAQTHDETEISR
jgi:hypothetical protein